jgi:ParB family chromosome partitioning protein
MKTQAGMTMTMAAVVSRRVRQDVPIPSLVRDEANRREEGDDDAFAELLDSVRVWGVLQEIHVQPTEGGKFVVYDGERRWTAAERAGLKTIPAWVWPADATREIISAALAMHEHRKPPSCLQVARRLRQLKNEYAESQEQLAARTGIPLVRVKSYLTLFSASDFLLGFFEEQNLPLRLAVEFVRYEKATSEAQARALARRHESDRLSVRDLEQARKRQDKAARPAAAQARAQKGLVPKIEAAFRRDPEQARRELEDALDRLGLRLVPKAVAGATKGST